MGTEERRGSYRPCACIAPALTFKRLLTLSEYYDRDHQALYAAIQGVRRAAMDMTGWLEYFVEGLSAQLAEVRAKGEAAIRADVVGAEHGLNGRQAALLSAFLERRDMSVGDCVALFPEVARRTVQRDLKALVEAGLVKELGRPTDPNRRYAAREA
jgi:Fic family protein